MKSSCQSNEISQPAAQNPLTFTTKRETRERGECIRNYTVIIIIIKVSQVATKVNVLAAWSSSRLSLFFQQEKKKILWRERRRLMSERKSLSSCTSLIQVIDFPEGYMYSQKNCSFYFWWREMCVTPSTPSLHHRQRSCEQEAVRCCKLWYIFSTLINLSTAFSTSLIFLVCASLVRHA